MQSENSIEIENVWKSYRSGAIKGSTLVLQLRSLMNAFRGKKDASREIVHRENITTEFTHRNQKFWALKGISFSVGKGEVVAVLGRNGAGKSTLLQILSRITEADKGVVRVRGRVASLLGAGVGFNEEMTGRENVYLSGSVLGMSPEEISAKMNAIADFAEIPEFMDTPVKRYSSGMRARLGFSVAVQLESEVMILDEVFATGDRVFRMKCINRMKELAASGRCILIVTHNPLLLKGLCERGVVLSEGNTVFDGDISKAIRIYLNTSKPKANKKLQLIPELKDREGAITMSQSEDPPKIDLVELSITDGENKGLEAYMIGSPLYFHLTIKSHILIQNLEVMLMLRGRMNGTLCRFQSPKNSLNKIREDEVIEITLAIPELPIGQEVGDLEFTIKLFELDEKRELLLEYVDGIKLGVSKKWNQQALVCCSHDWSFKRQ